MRKWKRKMKMKMKFLGFPLNNNDASSSVFLLALLLVLISGINAADDLTEDLTRTKSNAGGTPMNSININAPKDGHSRLRRLNGKVSYEKVVEEEDNTLSSVIQSLKSSHGRRRGKRVKRHIPIQSTLHPDGNGHLERIKLQLPLPSSSSDSSTATTVHLTLNRDLVGEGYFEKWQEAGEDVTVKPTYKDVDLCHYNGRVEGKSDSFAAISTCDGAITGIIFDGREFHYLEHHNDWGTEDDDNSDREETDSDSDSWPMLHYKESDLLLNTNDIGTGENHLHPLPSSNNNDSLLQHKNRVKRGLADHSDLRPPFNSNAKSRYVELVLVVDNKKYQDLGGDLKKTMRRTKDIANIVNALYQPFNIFIALVGVVVWTDRDVIKITPNGDDTLSSFLLYRRERLLKEHPNDNAQLLTAVEFENGVVGKAMQGPMCSYKYSGGVNSDSKNSHVNIVATTVAHEMGHNFGLSHDGEECHCPSPGNRCIMAPSASANRTSQWSSCSIKDMAYAFDHGMDYCLRNQPKSLYDGPTCGNGFTEPGEECDCGLADHCDNPCCDPHTCLMRDNATCASGTCCDTLTCHYKEGGIPCRDVSGLCDLPEYCTGESEFCPADVTKLDGLTCTTPNGDAFCYKGECRSHTDQCRLLWGPSGNNSDDLCYQRNSNGSRVAHCGYNLQTEKYAACPPQDSKCGVLHCSMHTEKLEYGYESAAILANFFVNSGGKIYPCRSVVVDFGLSDISPGMVPDGAPCGLERMCVSQKCTPVKNVMGALIDTCGGDCSGHGACNSKGHCHCDDGYGGSLCEGPGYGGSVDSGPPHHQGTSRFLRLLKVIIFGFIPLIGIIAFYLYYANGSLKKLCLEIRRGGLSAVVSNPSMNRPPGPPKPPPLPNGRAHVNSTAISSQPGSSSASGATSPIGEDFYGAYKGFSLSPVRKGGGTANNNNNNNNASASTSIVTADVTANSSPRVEDATLVGNSFDKPTLLKKNGTSRPAYAPHMMHHHQMRERGVSWAQPIEHRLPVSPPSEEDESAGSDTPLYDGDGGVITTNSSTGAMVLNIGSQGQQNPRPYSAATASSAINASARQGLRKENSFSGLTTRLAAALPFIRSQFSRRGGGGGSDTVDSSNKRGKVEISQPILSSDCIPKTKVGNFISINPLGGDEMLASHPPRYANIPLADGDESPTSPRYINLPQSLHFSKPGLKSVQRIRETTPPPQQPQYASSGPPPPPNPKKVQRAHSMIQSSSSSSPNRNSMPNYNSLRKNRPSAPPPKPPERGPSSLSVEKLPPPPPASVQETAPPPFRPPPFFKSSTPPPYNPSSTSPSPSSVRESIMKFSFGKTAVSVGGTTTEWLRSKLQNGLGSSNPPTQRTNSGSSTDSGISSGSETRDKTSSSPSPYGSRYGHGNYRSIFSPHSASILKTTSGNRTQGAPYGDLPASPPEEDSNPTSPSSVLAREDNIYDTIDEGICPRLEQSLNKRVELASSEESSSSSPSKESKGQSQGGSGGGSLEKMDTISTGSSENGAGGLLSEIISEIKSRNRESIYNSIDRKKMKARKKALANAALERESSPPNQSSYMGLTTPRNVGSSRASPIPSYTSSTTSRRDVSPSGIQLSRYGSYRSGSSSPVPLGSIINGSSLTGRKESSPSPTPPPKPAKPASPSPSPATSSSSTPPISSSSYKPYSSSTPSYQRPTAPISTTPPPVQLSSPKPMCAVNGIPKANPPLPPIPSPAATATAPTGSIQRPAAPFCYTKPPPPTSSSLSQPLYAGRGSPTPTPATTKSPSPSPQSLPQPQKETPPKTTSNTPSSYMAKINYFNPSTPPPTAINMRPLANLPFSKSSDHPAKEIIYAPSNNMVLNAELDPKNSSHLSTIRRSRPLYNQQSLEEESKQPSESIYQSSRRTSFDSNHPPPPPPHANSPGGGGSGTTQVFIKKPGGGGIYASLGRKVTAPVIRQDSLEKQKIIEPPPLASQSNKAPSEGSNSNNENENLKDTGGSVGYKPFNPYLNRPVVTFSTFRPSSGGGGGGGGGGGPPSTATTTATTNGN